MVGWVVGGAPVPVRVTVCPNVIPGAASAKFSVADSAVLTVGSKVIKTVQEAFAARLPPHVSPAIAKSGVPASEID